jgi:hypothetical protein
MKRLIQRSQAADQSYDEKADPADEQAADQSEDDYTEQKKDENPKRMPPEKKKKSFSTTNEIAPERSQRVKCG